MVSKALNRKYMELQEFQEMKLNVIKKSRFDLYGYQKKPEIYLIRDALRNFCRRMHQDLENICINHRDELSGSTIVSIFLHGN